MLIAFGRLYGLRRESVHRRRVRVQSPAPSVTERKRVPADRRRNVRRRRP